MTNTPGNATLLRAIYMLRVAGVHCGTFAADEESRYDDAVCDGTCIHASEAIAFYAKIVAIGSHAHAVWQRWYDFERFSRDNKCRMKEPDTETTQIEGGN